LLDVGPESLAVDRAVEQAGRFDSVVAQSGEEGRGRPMAVGDLVESRFPFGAQPPIRVMLVLVQVSSMKTRREGSISP